MDPPPPPFPHLHVPSIEVRVNLCHLLRTVPGQIAAVVSQLSINKIVIHWLRCCCSHVCHPGGWENPLLPHFEESWLWATEDSVCSFSSLPLPPNCLLSILSAALIINWSLAVPSAKVRFEFLAKRQNFPIVCNLNFPSPLRNPGGWLGGRYPLLYTHADCL